MKDNIQASSTKFWQSDEDGDDEAVIERVHRMPLRKKKFEHCDKIRVNQLCNSMVARPGGKAELISQPKAEKHHTRIFRTF